MAHLYFGILKLQHVDPAAETELKAAGDIYRDLVANNPTADNRFRLSQCDDRLGVYYLTQSRWKEAGERAEAAYAVRDQLVKDFPNDPEYQFRLAQSLRQRAAVQFSLLKTVESIASLKQAKTIQEKVLETNQTSAPYLALLADVETLLANYTAGPASIELKYGTLPDQKQETESVNFARDAVKTWGKLLSLYPGDPNYRRKLAEANLRLADTARDSGNARIAIDAVNASKTILDDLLRDLPNDRLSEELLGQVLHARAAIFRARGNRLATEAATAAVSFAESHVKANPGDLFWHSLAAKSLLEEEIIHRAEQRPEKAKAALEAAWRHIEISAKLGNAKDLTSYTRVATEGLAENKADKDAYYMAKRISELPLTQGRAEFEAARFHGQYCECIKLQPDYQQETDFPRCVKHIAYAIQLLKQAIQKGFRDADEMTTSIELKSVREAFEFNQLLEKLKVH